MFQDVINFWFSELNPKQWYLKDTELDDLIRRRFGSLHACAASGELFEWRESALGSLAEVIVLDQFSRNIYRDQPASFAQDPLALALSQSAIAKKMDLQLPDVQRTFLYMPFMHSESALIHQEAVKAIYKIGPS